MTFKTIRDWFAARWAEFKQAIRWGSIQLNVIASAVFAWLLASPDALLAAYTAVPAEFRGFVPPAFGTLLFILVYAVRVYKTNDIERGDD